MYVVIEEVVVEVGLASAVAVVTGLGVAESNKSDDADGSIDCVGVGLTTERGVSASGVVSVNLSVGWQPPDIIRHRVIKGTSNLLQFFMGFSISQPGLSLLA